MRVIGLLLSLVITAGATAWLLTGGPAWTAEDQLGLYREDAVNAVPEEDVVDPAPEKEVVGPFPEEDVVEPVLEKEELSAFAEAHRKMLLRDASSPERWCDLGEALEANGQLEQARYCFDRALDYGPNQPPLLMRAAEFYERTGQRNLALDRLARILHVVPEYDEDVFGMFEQMGIGVQAALDRGVPPEIRPAQSYLRRQMFLGKVPNSDGAWRWIRRRGLADDKLAGDYVGFLLSSGLNEKAAEVWTEQLGARRGGYRKVDYLFNGDFELNPSGSAFDWNILPLDFEDAEIAFETENAYSGQRALRIRFLGQENLDFYHIRQSAVLPAGRWRLTARVRSEDLTTDQGMRLRVFDAKAPARLNETTEPLRGSNPWQEMSLSFAVPEASRLIEVQVQRQPSLKIENKIGGTVWFDAVRLERIR